MFVNIKNFGGILPAYDKRALPPAGAQVNHNLLASVMHFKPLQTDLNIAASAVNDALTLYRLDRKANGSFNTDMTTGWVVNASVVSYVKGPVNNDTEERTYYTFDDGSAPPRWLDANGLDRLLGVPKPAAPTVAVTVVDEFTEEERAKQLDKAMRTIIRKIRTRLLKKWRGGTNPGTAGSAATGYINLQDNNSDTPNQAKQIRVYRFSSNNGARNGVMSNAYSAYGVKGYAFVTRPMVRASWYAPSATSPAFTGYNAVGPVSPDHMAISFTAYGLTYDVDTVNLATDLEAILMPGKTDGTKLLTNAQINGGDGLINRLTERLDITEEVNAAKLKALKEAVEDLRNILNGGTTAVLEAIFTAWFASTDWTAFYDNEITVFANGLFTVADNITKSATPENTLDAGGGNDGPT